LWNIGELNTGLMIANHSCYRYTNTPNKNLSIIIREFIYGGNPGIEPGSRVSKTRMLTTTPKAQMIIRNNYLVQLFDTIIGEKIFL
jgi:hypothetical protein